MTRGEEAVNLVLLNGWGMSAAAWTPLAQHLAAPIEPRPIDLPGYGGSPTSAAYDVERLAAAVADAAPARCAVLGWSLGAQVALQWARACPQQVRQLVLVAATPCFVRRENWDCAMPRSEFDRFERNVAADAASALARFALLQAQGEAKIASVARTLRAACELAPQAALLGGLDLLKGDDLRSSVKDVRAPALIVHGEGDALVPVAAARYLHASLPGAQLQVLSGAGHAPHVSRARAVAELLTDFLREH